MRLLPAERTQPGQRLGLLVGLMTLVALARSLALVGWNQGEYTDGILVVGRDVFGPTYWPIGYTWMSWLVAALLRSDPESGGRVVSAIFGAAVVPAIMLGAAWMAGPANEPADKIRKERLALGAGVAYLALPEPWRWSIRVMTDSQFMALGAWALFAWTVGLHGALDGERGWARWYAAATLLGLGATLTRHQGIFLAPLAVAGSVAILLQRRKVAPAERTAWNWTHWLALALPLLWAVWPLVERQQASAHAGQVSFRVFGAGGGQGWIGIVEPMLQVWAMFEAYLYLTPYVITPGLAILALVGAFRGAWCPPRARLAACAWAWMALCLLVSQAFFQSFLSRYLLPLMPAVAGAASFGVAAMIDWRPRVGMTFVVLALLFGFAFGGASIILQRGAFGDIAQAAVALADLEPKDVPVFANETYKAEAELGAIKLQWWSGRDVLPFSLLAANSSDGALVVLSSAYGGPEYYRAAESQLVRQLGATVAAGPFESWLVPMLPDIMQSPQYGHQSPLAWIYRFAPQRFQTVILRIPARASGPLTTLHLGGTP